MAGLLYSFLFPSNGFENEFFGGPFVKIVIFFGSPLQLLLHLQAKLILSLLNKKKRWVLRRNSRRLFSSLFGVDAMWWRYVSKMCWSKYVSHSDSGGWREIESGEEKSAVFFLLTFVSAVPLSKVKTPGKGYRCRDLSGLTKSCVFVYCEWKRGYKSLWKAWTQESFQK